MRRKDVKETTVKTMWNPTIKLLQDKYFKEIKVIIGPFKSVVFQ